MALWSRSTRETAEGRSGRPRSINIFLGFFLALNNCVGIGFLGIPYGFFYAGFVTSIPTLLVLAFATWVSANWEIETMARAEAVVAFKQSLRSTYESEGVTGNADEVVGFTDTGTHQTQDVTGDEDEKEGGFTDTDTHQTQDVTGDEDEKEGKLTDWYESENVYPNFQIRLTRNFEPTELCEVFFNRWVKCLYMLVMIIYNSTWTGTVIVTSAWATNIPFDFDTVKQCKSDAFQHHRLPTDQECVNAYRICLLIYGVIMVTLSVINLKDQAILQMLLGLMRFAMIGAIVTYCVVSLIEGGNACIGTDPYSNSSSNRVSNLSNASVVTNTTHYFDFSRDFLLKFDWKGWVVSIPVFTYAFILHPAVPTLTQPVKQKQYLHWLIMTLFVVTTAAYLSLGMSVSLWFRGSIQETATLNWVTLSRPGHSPQLRALSYFIVLFPTLDICTANPLSYHAVANNIYAVFVTRKVGRPKHRYEWIIRPTLRFFIAVIPLIPALFISNLVYVLSYTGLTGFAICLLFPAALQLQSQRVCKKLFGGSYRSVTKKTEQQSCVTSGESDADTVPLLSVQREVVVDSKRLYMTPYSNRIFSHPVAVVILGTLGVITFVLGIISFIVKPDTLKCQAYQ